MTARLVTSAAEIGAARWNALANPQGLAEPHPFTTFAFFEAVEASGSACRETGWQPCHLLADDALMPMYLKSHSQGEYVFDHAWADALERAGGDYYPKLQASVPFTPVTGPRLFGNRELLLRAAAGALKARSSSAGRPQSSRKPIPGTDSRNLRCHAGGTRLSTAARPKRRQAGPSRPFSVIIGPPP